MGLKRGRRRWIKRMKERETLNSVKGKNELTYFQSLHSPGPRKVKHVFLCAHLCHKREDSPTPYSIFYLLCKHRFGQAALTNRRDSGGNKISERRNQCISLVSLSRLKALGHLKTELHGCSGKWLHIWIELALFKGFVTVFVCVCVCACEFACMDVTL